MAVHILLANLLKICMEQSTSASSSTEEGSTVGSLYTINGAITSSGDSSELELTLVASVSVATVQKCDTLDEGQASNTFVTKDCTAGISASWLYGCDLRLL